MHDGFTQLGSHVWNQRLDWSKNGNSFTYSVVLPKMVNCSYIESIADSGELGYSKALVLQWFLLVLRNTLILILLFC